ncbi:MAG: right-handed parallel beta-helix repeat-containing protein, partial [Armatimonadetes bacterium]|nr:right-handed parallel beta-helix repeat-containing protein [Armatimonadota bacterium]
DKHIIELAQPYHHYGYRKGQWYYAFNALCELDQPGEWYLDRETGILYFWPPGDIRKSRVMVSVLGSVVEAKGLANVTLRGFTIDGCRGTAMVLSDCTGVRVVGCTIRNTGGSAISLSGRGCSVIGCDMYNLGAGGVSVAGGNRQTLTPARNEVENCHIHHYGRIRRMYTPAIGLDGVGNRAAHNMIHDAPHQAIAFGGNDHVIEYNEIYRVCTESNDAGAIYAGRDWTMRGTVIRYNYFRDITGFENRGCVGVYLDDMFCGTTIFGNVFYNVTRAAFIGGGRDNIVENNIFVDCNPAVHLDARAMGWARDAVDGVMKQRLLAMPYKSPLWAERYPELVNIWEDEPAVPKGNVIVRNVCWGGRWAEWEERVLKYQKIEDNLIGVDPRFVDLENGNFQLRDDSPAWKIGFKRIPFEKIGLYRDSRRASWPVVREQVKVPPRPRVPQEARRGPAPVCRAALVRRAPTIDGDVSAAEWLGADRSKALPVREGINGEIVKPPSWAWVVWDGRYLYVAVENELAAAGAVSGGHKWGADDAGEIAICPQPGERSSYIIVLRGYTDGHFESSSEAGAPKEAVERALTNAKYAAKVAGKSWRCEWRISLSAIGLDPSRSKQVPFNISVRKTKPEPQWLMWRGTGGYTWAVEKAGILELGQ